MITRPGRKSASAPTIHMHESVCCSLEWRFLYLQGFKNITVRTACKSEQACSILNLTPSFMQRHITKKPAYPVQKYALLSLALSFSLPSLCIHFSSLFIFYLNYFYLSSRHSPGGVATRQGSWFESRQKHVFVFLKGPDPLWSAPSLHLFPAY